MEESPIPPIDERVQQIIVDSRLGPDDINMLWKVFQGIDKEKLGFITQGELHAQAEERLTAPRAPALNFKPCQVRNHQHLFFCLMASSTSSRLPRFSRLFRCRAQTSSTT